MNVALVTDGSTFLLAYTCTLKLFSAKLILVSKPNYPVVVRQPLIRE